ncbi:MAG: hypothetical protein PHQ23_09350 [Candidatus Wallbacteria bacterium]|nr:hypothetical protein [Candidatus Wallbacteria bacterium]
MDDVYKKTGIALGFFFFFHHYILMKVIPGAMRRFLRLTDRYLAKNEAEDQRDKQHA